MDNQRLMELWRIARTAIGRDDRFDRLQYVVKEYVRENPSAVRKQVYLTADDLTRGYGHQ